MKTFARFLLVGSMLLARCAWATDLSPVAFAKSVVSERGSQTFATVSYPDRSLIVEFRLEPYSTGKTTAVRAFGEITKKIAQGAFSRFPKIKSVQLIGNLALRDKHGNDTVDRAVMVKFSKVSAATIKWEDVDPADIVEIADKHWILPELGADKKYFTDSSGASEIAGLPGLAGEASESVIFQGCILRRLIRSFRSLPCSRECSCLRHLGS